MDHILNDLNQAVGIIGSMVFTRDGEFVTGRIGKSIDRETGAALAADMIKGFCTQFSKIGKDDFSQVMLEAMNGKIVVYNTGPAYLFVLANQNIHLNVTILDIQSASRRIRKELE